ncbi:MAG TPA: NAD(P)-dependent oxidoreductase [Solimonas sp.]|nr:NAD(P)-dependent oxidoreductase [Solimonas sp.]
MKVLLTGALGNIGEYTLKALLDEGHEVTAFELDSPSARKRAAHLDGRVIVAWGDITDMAAVRTAVTGVDAVIHLAGMVPPNVARNPDLARRVNVGGTKNLITLMEASVQAKRLIFASSIGVFGDVQDREPPLRADTPISPSDDYGRHKVDCEVAIGQSRLQWTILRLGAAVPTRLIGTHYDPRAGFEISANSRIEFVHPADAGLAFARAVSCEGAVGKVLYIGGGKDCQMITEPFYNRLMDGIGIGPIPSEVFVRADPPRFTGDWMDTEESQQLLRYQTRGLEDLKTDMRKGLGVFAPVVRLLRPVVTYFYVRSSPYLKENRSRN